MLFDSHTHVNFKDFNNDRDAVIKRCLDEDIWMINVGTNAEYSKKAIEIAHAYPEGVCAAVGVHPNDGEKADEFSVIEELAKDKKVVAIGETGLDYYGIRNQESDIKNHELRIRNQEEHAKKQQQELFIKHIKLALKIDKPLIIHCRDAHNDLFSILNSYFTIHNSIRGVLHFFTGTKEDAEKYLNLGFYLSFSGVLTFTHDYDELVRCVPLDRILVETDAPFAAPVPHRGKRNEPSYVKYTAQRIADIKGLSFEEVAENTTKNTRGLFRI